CVQAIAFPPSC
nr:immunoglobulin light chain junction region [Macaca mulatta]